MTTEAKVICSNPLLVGDRRCRRSKPTPDALGFIGCAAVRMVIPTVPRQCRDGLESTRHRCRRTLHPRCLQRSAIPAGLRAWSRAVQIPPGRSPLSGFPPGLQGRCRMSETVALVSGGRGLPPAQRRSPWPAWVRAVALARRLRRVLAVRRTLRICEPCGAGAAVPDRRSAGAA